MPGPTTRPSLGFQAVILCGPGMALYPFTGVGAEDLPKALLPIANKPMIHYPLEWCESAGFDSVLVLTLAEHQAAVQSYIRSRAHKVKVPIDYYTVEAASSSDENLGTADVLRVAYRKGWIDSDFVVVPCDLVTNLDAVKVAELWLVAQAGLDGDLGRRSRKAHHACDSEDGRRGALGVWYETMGEGAVKGQEADFLVVAPRMSPSAIGRKRLPEGDVATLLNTAPTQAFKGVGELPLRRGMLKKFPDFKLYSTYRDSGIYFLPYWILKFIERNPRLNSIREDVLPWIAKARWQNRRLADRLGLPEVLTGGSADGDAASDEVVSQTYDVASMSSTQKSRASRTGSEPKMEIPSITAYLPSSPSVFIRRVDTTHLYLFACLHLAKTDPTTPSNVKIDPNASIGPKAIVTAIDCLIADKVSIGERAVIKKSVLGYGVSIGRGARLTGCVLMDGASVAENAKLESCIVGRNAMVRPKAVLKDCEIAEGYQVEEGAEAKGERFVASMGLEPDSDEAEAEDDASGDDSDARGDDDDEETGEEGESFSSDDHADETTTKAISVETIDDRRGHWTRTGIGVKLRAWRMILWGITGGVVGVSIGILARRMAAE